MSRCGANGVSRFHDVSGASPRKRIRTATRRLHCRHREGFLPCRPVKLQIRQANGSEELTVGSQKEFLRLWNSGVIAADDLVRRGDRWVRAKDLPFIHGMVLDRRRDGRRLFFITLALMVLGLAGVLFIQRHAPALARRTGALPPGAVRAVPR